MRFGWAMAMAAAAMAVPATAQQQGVGALGWLAGHWIMEEGDRWAEEAWMAPRADIMIGSARSGRGDRAAGFEFMRIAADESGAVHFYGSPGGAPAVAFRLVEQGESSATFENIEHDFPNRVRYWREGELLRGEISGPGGADPTGWSYRPAGTPGAPD